MVLNPTKTVFVTTVNVKGPVMLNIELVKVVRNGIEMLVGRRFQDRWALANLGIKTGIKYDRNQTAVKTMRRRLAGSFTVSVVRNASPLPMSDTERAMFTSNVVSVAA